MKEKLDNIVEENINDLDEIKSHTEYKIKYIKEYVENWLRIMVNNKQTSTINFIDCMCNAGIYVNKVLGTPTEVLKLFIEFAKNNPTKKFNVFLNDYNEKRIEIINEIFNLYNYKSFNNIEIYFSSQDVNMYLDNLINYGEKFFSKKFNDYPATILFADPYCFGKIKIKKLIDFTQKYYSELIFNYFNSDYRRNSVNESQKLKQEMIIYSMEGIEEFNPNMNESELEILIQKSLKGKNIKRCFSYPFKIETNVVLYHIIYATPSDKGLETIKEVLWKVFDGSIFYKKIKVNDNQLSFFNKSDYKDMNLKYYSEDAQERVYKKYRGNLVSYKDISIFVLENTMLKEGQIIDYIIKPLINMGKIIKKNNISKRNYKNDVYSFKEY